MIEADRLISAEPINEEEILDRAIRPKLLTEYVGQPHVREQMEIFIQAAKQRGDALDHLLIFGPPVGENHHGQHRGQRNGREFAHHFRPGAGEGGRFGGDADQPRTA